MLICAFGSLLSMVIVGYFTSYISEEITLLNLYIYPEYIELLNYYKNLANEKMAASSSFDIQQYINDLYYRNLR